MLFRSPSPVTYDIDGIPDGTERPPEDSILNVAAREKGFEIVESYQTRANALGYPILLSDTKFHHDMYTANIGTNLDLDDLFHNATVALAGIAIVGSYPTLQQIIDFDPETDIPWA